MKVMLACVGGAARKSEDSSGVAGVLFANGTGYRKSPACDAGSKPWMLFMGMGPLYDRIQPSVTPAKGLMLTVVAVTRQKGSKLDKAAEIEVVFKQEIERRENIWLYQAADRIG